MPNLGLYKPKNRELSDLNDRRFAQLISMDEYWAEAYEGDQFMDNGSIVFIRTADFEEFYEPIPEGYDFENLQLAVLKEKAEKWKRKGERLNELRGQGVVR